MTAHCVTRRTPSSTDLPHRSKPGRRAGVIGAGLGGLATAARLAHAGYQVTVLERHAVPGGRAGLWESEGFRFDTGPSLVLMVEYWQQLFRDVGCAFTLIGGIMLTVSGIPLIRIRGYVIGETPWLAHGIGALASSTLVWLAVLLPDQWRLERMDPSNDAALRRVFLRWTVAGWATTGILFYGLWAMVTGRVP